MSYSYAIVSVDDPSLIKVSQVAETDPDRPLLVEFTDAGWTLAILHLDDRSATALVDSLIEVLTERQVIDAYPF